MFHSLTDALLGGIPSVRATQFPEVGRLLGTGRTRTCPFVWIQQQKPSHVAPHLLNRKR